MDQQRVSFTPEQADSLLPVLSALLLGLQEDLGMATDQAAIERLQPLAGHNGGGEWASKALAAGERARCGLQELAEKGLVLRDPESGLIDFPSEVDGIAAFLCWRLGEPRVDWWHPRDQGYASRRRLVR